MNNYLLNKIIEFQERIIPLNEYPNQVRALRHQVSNYINIKQLYLKQMLYNNEIDVDDYRYMKIIIEYEKCKIQNLINQR